MAIKSNSKPKKVKKIDNKKSIKELEKKLIRISLEIAKKGEGGLFVIGDKINYAKLLKQKLEPFNAFDSGADKILLTIAMIDGAVIINKKGDVLDYGALIKNSKPFIGFGTRHAAAITASEGNNIAILCSEEEKKVKIFKNGKYIMQLDALSKNINNEVSTATTILETIGAGFLGTLGAATLVPAVGITLIPGVIVFGGSYLAIKSLLNLHKGSEKK